jgi:hypothetical protein
MIHALEQAVVIGAAILFVANGVAAIVGALWGSLAAWQDRRAANDD